MADQHFTAHHQIKVEGNITLLEYHILVRESQLLKMG
jgi:hypothetical protein